MSDIGRIVALGASNLTFGFHSLVSAARAIWGPDVQVLAALGLGRSYGAPSRVVIRTLPGILESGLWQRLESLPDIPTRALVTDVGNDILYGYSAEQILAWIEEVLNRLQRVTRDIVLTDLPLASVRRLSRMKYLMFRSVFFPSSSLSHDQVLKTGEQVNAGIAELSISRGVRLFMLNPAWYGFDPIHIRRSLRRSAWQEMLGARSALKGGGCSFSERLRISLMAPERRWILGIEQFTPQSGVALPSGSRVWFY